MSPMRLLFAFLLFSLALPPGALSQDPHPAPMTGTWLYRDQNEEIVLVLNIDGTYQLKDTTAQGVQQESGNWDFSTSSYITFRPVNDQPESYECGMMDQNTLAIALQGAQTGNPLVLYLQRVDGPQQNAAGQGYQNQPMVQTGQPPVQNVNITGAWQVMDQGQKIYLQLDQGGTFLIEVAGQGGTDQNTGQWSFDGRVLSLNAVQAAPETHQVAFQGPNVLVVNMLDEQNKPYQLRMDRVQPRYAPGQQQPVQQQPMQQGAQQAPPQALPPQGAMGPVHQENQHAPMATPQQGQNQGQQQGAAGPWAFELDGTVFALILQDSGWFMLQNMTNVQEAGIEGDWSWDGQTLTLKENGNQEPSTFGMVLAGPGRATLQTYNDQNRLIEVPMVRMKEHMENGRPVYELPANLDPNAQNQPQPTNQQPQPMNQQQGQQQHQQNPVFGVLPETMVFKPYLDSTEKAFTVLVPDGWYVKGGILRVDPSEAGGPANSIEAKIDFSVHKDQQSTVAAYVLPTYYYTTLGGSMVQTMYPEGSYYYGMEVLHLMDPVEFAVRKAFPYAHPNAGQPQVVAQRELPELAKAYRIGVGSSVKSNFSYKAAMVELRYQENGVDYHERMAVVIEDRGYVVAGQWSNIMTLAVRAPWGQLDAWEPVFRTVSDSFAFDKEWMSREIRNQIQGSAMTMNLEQEIQRIDQEITKHRQETNAIIANQMFLNLTGQQNYVDPDTGQVQQATNAWQHRLKAPDGGYVFTNNSNALQQLAIQGYKETKAQQAQAVHY